MPTNLPPDYFDLERQFREAESTAEKISLLEKMYSIVPKHKGTDHLRADLRRQLSKLKEEAQKTRKKHGGHTPVFFVEKEGAGQVAIIGSTNVGKSALVLSLTNAKPEVSEAPYTTWKPISGMMPIENIQVQLVDTPPLDRGFVDRGLFDLIRKADLVLLMLDLQADPLKQLQEALALLREHHIVPQDFLFPENTDEQITYIPTVVVVNKCDDEILDEDMQVLCDLFEGECPLIPVSAITGRYFEELKKIIYDRLKIIRVYAKPPGKDADLDKPFALKKGSTIADLARMVHRHFYDHLKTARVWGSTEFEGQMVQRDYILQEGDIVELRA